MPPGRTGRSESRLELAWEHRSTDHIQAASWSPDGQAVAVALISGPILIFNLKGAVLHQLKGHGFGTQALDWQPGGTLLASAGQDGKLKLWNTTTGEEVASLAGGAGWVECVKWSPDGQFLASAAGKKVRLWNAAGLQLKEYADHAATVSDLAWEPGRGWLTVAAYGAVKSYDLVSDQPVQMRAWKGSPLKLAWSPDGKCLAQGNQDCTVHFWTDNPNPLQMSGFPAKVRELGWYLDSRYLATGGGPAICLWDTSGSGPEGRTPQMLFEEESPDPLTALAPQTDGFLIAGGGPDGLLRVWQPANKRTPCVGKVRFSNAGISVLAWTPNDKHLLCGTSAGVLALFKV